MPATRLAIALTGLVLVAGCSHSQSARGVDTEELPAAARISPDDLPPTVRTAFRRDHPDAAVTDITPLSAETGAPLYRVTFIDSGTAGDATYYMNGQRLTSDTP
jgi:hypothetical protein